MWPYKGEALVSQENFCRLEKSVRHLINYVTKTILSDAESCEERDANKYSSIGCTTAELWTFLR